MPVTPSTNAGDSGIEAIQRWYNGQCDGLWENYFGISVVSTDNPGWLATLSGCSVQVELLSETLQSMPVSVRPTVSFEGTTVSVFSTSLNDCLQSVAMLLEKHILGHKRISPPREGNQWSQKKRHG